MKLTFIGTSHGVPEHDRRCSSYMLEVKGKYYIFDMGTETIQDLRERGIAISDIALVICSHPHGDHTNGLISFVDLISWYFGDAHPTILLPTQALIDSMKAWISATDTTVREDLDITVYHEGIAFEDENVRVTTIRTKHCSFSYAFLVEAEGRRILFTNDLAHPDEDFPAVAFETELDLLVCEAAHFLPSAAIPYFDRARVKRVLHAHVAPACHEDLARQMSQAHPYLYGDAYDGLEINF